MIMKKAPPKEAADLIANLPWGTHCCNFYKAKTDLLDMLALYFKAGLSSNELCLWVTSKPVGVKDIIRAMRKAVPRFDSYLERGQMEIHSYDEWYLQGGAFDSRRVLDRWLDKYNRASAKGYDGMRLTGNAFRLEKTSWKRFVDYEEQLDKTIATHRIKALCTYSLDLCGAHDVIDVVKNHGYALIKRGTWELIENVQRRRAEEKALEKAMAELARMVKSRTRELEETNGKLRLEIAERERMEEALRMSREQLRALAAYLQSVREEEKRRIARELHDEVGQALTGIKLSLQKNTRQQPGVGGSGLGQTVGVINELIGRVRDMSLDLRPAMLDDLGLLAALAWHFDRYTGQCSIKVDFKHAGFEGRRFEPEIETAAYRIVQEALTNVARHAGVDRVRIEIRADREFLHIRIQDRGAGFDADSLPARRTGGLSGMRERAILLGGKLAIDSAAGRGTVLTAELPLKKRFSDQQPAISRSESTS
jgi:signal transduction histidine kinase